MKTLLRAACVVVLPVLALAGTTPAAQAKGPTDVMVSGPGVDDVQLTYTEPIDDVDSGSLGEASRLYDMWSPGLLEPAPDLTEDELGPRYVLTWSGDPHSGETGKDLVVQHAYPFAEGGAWVEFPRDQELWGAPIAEGWIQTPRLTAELVELGAVDDAAEPAVAVEPEAGPVTSAAEASPAEDDSSSSYGVGIWTGAALAVALATGVVLLWRRRLSR
jgi:hypothetical protein